MYVILLIYYIKKTKEKLGRGQTLKDTMENKADEEEAKEQQQDDDH